MSIIFQTLQKLSHESAENIKKQIDLKKNLRTYPLSKNQQRAAVAILSLCTLFILSVVMYYLTPDSTDRIHSKDTPSVSYSAANASTVPSSLENAMQTVFLSDENVRNDYADPDPFVFIPPVSNGAFKGVSDGSPKETEKQNIKPVQKTIIVRPDFTPAEPVKQSVRLSPLAEQKIVKRIENAIIEGNMENAEGLFEQLAAIKGEDSIYVMKLRAFFLLHAGENRAAISLLKKVLAGNADDVEAGINMAILEIRLRDYELAKVRLTRLKSLYPENAVISNLLSKLDY